MRSEPGRLARWRAKAASHYERVYARDREWIMQFNLGTMQNIIWPLFVAFICLNFLDVYTTTLAFTFGPLFHEMNPIAAGLFGGQFPGYLLALTFKYLPMVPLFYLVFVQGDEKNAVQMRILKLAALVSLVGADALLFYVVGINNLSALLSTV